MAENEAVEIANLIGSQNQPRTHILERTSPKGEGEVFIGKCTWCGRENLPSSAALERCIIPSMDDKSIKVPPVRTNEQYHADQAAGIQRSDGRPIDNRTIKD